MRHQTQENTARRIGFDIELPPEARSELLQPKRPVILGRSSPRRGDHQREHSGVLKWAATFMLCAVLLAGVIGHYSQGPKAPGTPQPDPVLQHSREILQQSTSAPMQRPVSQPPLQQPTSQPPRLVWEWVRSEAYGPVWVQCYAGCTPARGGLIIRDPAPHAQLVQTPVPRAELVRLPQ
jgi:hypothetical protein